MPTCIYSKTTFVTATKEHILQNHFGARWASPNIVCDEVQAEFGKSIDSALEEAFRPLRMLVGSDSGRGDEAPGLRKLKASSGEIVDLKAGGQPVIAEPQVSVVKNPEGTERIKMELGNEKQLEWALHKLRTQYPGLKIDEQAIRDRIKNGEFEKEETYLQGPVTLPMKFGGGDYFRALLKSCFNLLGAINPDVALRPEFDAVREYILRGNGDASNFLRWIVAPPQTATPTLGDFGHFIGIVSRDGAVDAIVVLYGAFAHSIRLSDSYAGPAIREGYAVDPLREMNPAENRKVDFIESSIPNFEAQSKLPTQEVWGPTSAMVRTVVDRFLERARSAEVRRIVEKELLPDDGQPIPKEMLDKVTNAIAKFAVRGMPHQ